MTYDESCMSDVDKKEFHFPFLLLYDMPDYKSIFDYAYVVQFITA